MTIPTSGPVTMQDIGNEFGWSMVSGIPGHPGSFNYVAVLHDYVRGGSMVPDTPQNAGVPTSPPITIDDLRGASAAQPLTGTLPDISATKTATAHQIPNPSPPPPYFTAYRWDGGTIGTATASISGGDGTYSYSWSITGQTWNVSGSGATATVSEGFQKARGTYTETLTCVVSDGQQSITLTSTVTLEVV